MSDDYQIGRTVRDLRLARGLRQEDVAARARVSRKTISRLERGLVDGITVVHLRAISRAMDMPSIVALVWRGPEMDRLRDRIHAAIVETAERSLSASGWSVTPEYTFSVYGERGSVDILAWHPTTRVLLIGRSRQGSGTYKIFSHQLTGSGGWCRTCSVGSEAGAPTQSGSP